MTTVPPAPAPPIRPRPMALATQMRRVPVTFGMIGVTGTVFVLQLVGKSLLGYDVILDLGAKSNELILAGQIWRLVTPVFIHAGVLHIFVNMYSLFAIGPPVERVFGTARMLALYLLSGVGGVISSVVFNPYPSVGASGAIFGLLGALAMFLYMHRGVFGRAGGMQLRQLILVGGLNLILSLSPGIDLWGHVGGLIAGAACTAFFGPRLTPVIVGGVGSGLHDERPWPEVAPRVVLAVIALGAAALAGLFLASRA